MKIEDVVYRVAGRTLELLEKRYHYRIPEEHKRDIQATMRENLAQLLKEEEQQPAHAEKAAHAAPKE